MTRVSADQLASPRVDPAIWIETNRDTRAQGASVSDYTQSAHGARCLAAARADCGGLPGGDAGPILTDIARRRPLPLSPSIQRLRTSTSRRVE
jgi:hypothetical protein